MNAFDLFDLRGQVSMVTGGGYGLGKMMATGLAMAGSDIAVCSRKLEKCETAAHEIAELGVEALPLQCDITSDKDVDRAVRETVKRFRKIDILVNNAGMGWGAAPEDMKIEDWQKVVDLNITGVFRFTQKAGREMITQKRGKIINISSYAGFRGTDPDFLNSISYNASKGAIIAFTKDLATKWARHNINVNCIAPGFFPTKMTKWSLDNWGDKILTRLLIKRFGKEDDLRGAVIYLASKASDYVTGHVLVVDGGLLAW
jgi:gluconate 5-dehydrogenase